VTTFVRWTPPVSGLVLQSSGGAAASRTSQGDPTIASSLTTGRFDDDRAIVDAVLAGDPDGFRALVDREGPAVVRACSRILGDRTEAEDIAQEAFVIAYRSLPTWRGEGTFGAWVSRIAVRLALRVAAKRRNVTWLDPFAAESGSAGNPDQVRLGTTDAPDPAVHALRAERDVELRRAVATLDEPYREVVALRFFAGLSESETAEVLSCPVGTAKSRLSRALDVLRATLGEEVML
jgi:RNA polymerase sigma-70 factor (ECF subfamily)